MDDELIKKFREVLPNEEQLKQLINAVDGTPDFDIFLKEDDENIKLVVDSFLKVSAEKQLERSLMEAEIDRYQFMINIRSGSMGELEVSADKVKAIEDWLKAVEASDEKTVLESTLAAAKAIKAIVISGEAFKERKKGRGRPEKGDDNTSYIWAFSECYGVEAAAAEFKKSASSIKKIRASQGYLKDLLSEKQIKNFSIQIADGYEHQKSKK